MPLRLFGPDAWKYAFEAPSYVHTVIAAASDRQSWPELRTQAQAVGVSAELGEGRTKSHLAHDINAAVAKYKASFRTTYDARGGTI